MKTRIIIGSRGSKLALIQAGLVMAEIKKTNPHLKVSISQITTSGDRESYKQFDNIEGNGVFVKELETALLDGKIDFAVHSLKDMPAEIPQGLSLAAVTQRLDPRDVLISAGAKRLAEMPPGAHIGTGSPRRAAQLTACRPDLKTSSIKGNVDSRLSRITNNELDGVIIAAAGLIRLGWEDRISDYLPIEYFLPAVGQGALAIETRIDDEETVRLVSGINHLPTRQSVTAERALLRTMGGDCHAPIAALGTLSGKTLRLRGMFAEPDRNQIVTDTEEGATTEAEEIGICLARKLFNRRTAGLTLEARKNDQR